VDRGFELVEDRSDSVIAALRAACPSRGDKPAGHYIAIWEFAQHLVDLLNTHQTSEFPAVFAAVERLMVGDEVGVRDLITIGLVEDLQNLMLDTSDSLAAGFRPWLGPLTVATWDRVHRFWGTNDGDTPLASENGVKERHGYRSCRDAYAIDAGPGARRVACVPLGLGDSRRQLR
jgi:hypothetical protein